MKEFLIKLIENKKAELKRNSEKMKSSTDVEEVRAIGETLIALRDEITAAEEQLAGLEAGEDTGAGEDGGAEGEAVGGDEENSRSTKFKPLATYGAATRGNENMNIEEKRASMEYRKAFMEFVRSGKTSEVLEIRSNDQNESGDLGVLLPETVVQEIIKGTEKVYGQLYSRVKKTNIKGGVKYPVGAFDAVFTRIGENGAPTDRQNGGAISGYVEFSYKIGEIRLAQTLLASVLSVPVFESELAKVIVEAYVKAMDKEILTGSTANECEGIITEAAKATGGRIPAENIIEFSADDMKDWKQWQKKLFAKIPLAMRALKPEFVMTAGTYESNIKTLADGNNRPLYAETFNPIDGSEKATFKAHEVIFVEDGNGLVNFDDGSTGDIFGLYWIPEKAYAINTNLEFAVKRYFDNETLQYVDRAVVINDGKILDPKFLYVLKKAVSA